MPGIAEEEVNQPFGGSQVPSPSSQGLEQLLLNEKADTPTCLTPPDPRQEWGWVQAHQQLPDLRGYTPPSCRHPQFRTSDGQCPPSRSCPSHCNDSLGLPTPTPSRQHLCAPLCWARCPKPFLSPSQNYLAKPRCSACIALWSCPCLQLHTGPLPV
jgi:hypothetical protein